MIYYYLKINSPPRHPIIVIPIAKFVLYIYAALNMYWLIYMAGPMTFIVLLYDYVHQVMAAGCVYDCFPPGV